MPYSLTQVNDAIRSDPKAFVEECDAAYAKKVETAAKKIAEHRSESHVILLSGPSGSGKTTTALKIEEALEKLGIETHTVSMDNYFNTVDPETAPRNREGQIDYESPFCLDVDLLNRHFAMLDRGETIHVPKYEFARQMRSDIFSQPMHLGQDELAIFEGIHALNDIIVGKNPHAFKLYIAARSNLLDEDSNVVFNHAWLRLCRRIAEGHGGVLMAESQVGKGSRFTLSLPDQQKGTGVSDVAVDYSGGFNPTLLSLADALPVEAFLIRNQD